MKLITPITSTVEIANSLPQKLGDDRKPTSLGAKWTKCSKCENLMRCNHDEKDFDINGNCKFYREKKTKETREFSEVLNAYRRVL